jgi:hypothetical protein
MACLLHLCLRTDDLTDRVIARQRRQEHAEVVVVDLNQTDPDYDALVTAIFAADRVAVWT